MTYCRQHYQRCRYRQSAHAFAALRMDLVRKATAKLETWGKVRDWDIQLRKRATGQIKQEDAATERGAFHQELPTGNADCSFMSTCRLEPPDRRVISH